MPPIPVPGTLSPFIEFDFVNGICNRDSLRRVDSAHTFHHLFDFGSQRYLELPAPLFFDFGLLRCPQLLALLLFDPHGRVEESSRGSGLEWDEMLGSHSLSEAIRWDEAEDDSFEHLVLLGKEPIHPLSDIVDLCRADEKDEQRC